MKQRLGYIGITTLCFAISVFLSIHSSNNQIHAVETEDPGETDALRAFDWWYDQRALPNETIPHGALQKGANYVKYSMNKERNLFPKTDGVTQWTSMGPDNVGGRVLSIAVNPQNTSIVWAGSASGGLWKSTNKGTSWSFVNTGFVSLSVSTIAIDSLHPNVMYIGTGEISRWKRPLIGVVGARASYGLGILKSTDAGATWDTTGLTFTFPEITAIEKIIINPKNSNTIFAATSEGTFRSKDAGKSWGLSHNNLMAMDIVMNPVDTTILYASYGNLNSTSGAGIYMTVDAGDGWFPAGTGLPTTNFGRTALSISPTDPSVIYAGVSDGSSGAATGLFKTTNLGTTWVSVSSLSYMAAQGWYDNVVAVDPTDPNVVYASGFNIYKSTNGGPNLADITGGTVHPDQHAIAFDPTDHMTMYFGCDGGMFKSTDGGNTFINLNNGFVTTQFYPGLSSSPLDSNVAMGGLQDNGTLRYFGSTSWAIALGADGGWTSISSTDKHILYGEFQNLLLWKSTDGGGSFSNVNNGLPNGSANTNFIPPFTISYSDPNVLYAGTKNVYKTTNAGASWFAANGAASLNGTFVSCIGVSYTNPDTVMAGTGQGILGPAPMFKIYSSTNGGTVWTEVTGTLPYRYPTDIEFDPTNSSTAYLTYSGYGGPHVFKTTDIGQHWTDISSNLPDIPHQAVIVDPEDPTSLYVGTDLGVFHSSNGGTSWEEFNDGMPTSMVLDVTVSRANNALRAATFGHGVYERKIPRTPSLAVARPNGGEVWIAGATENITWSQKYLNAVKIEYSLNNGTSWTTIADSVPTTLPFYPWIVPNAATSQGLIRISATSSGLYPDISNAPFSIIFSPDVVGGWNLISLNLAAPDQRKIILFPGATSEAYTYGGSYIKQDTLRTGFGYWLKYSVPQYTNYTGDSILTDTINVIAGWNMIGAITSPVTTGSIIQLPSNIVSSSFFGYQSSYSAATTLMPKQGYWVKTTANGKLILASPTIATRQHPQEPFSPDGYNAITISDRTEKKQTLYFLNSDETTSLAQFELPPTPPPGVFDVRFATQRMAEHFGKQFRSSSIIISGAEYPLTVHWKMNNDKTEYALSDNENTTHHLEGEGTMTLTQDQAENLSVRANIVSPEHTPAAFSLEQNYPNPFNPATKVSFVIHQASFVKLTVYDVLGQEVETLVKETKQPGTYQVEFNANSIPTGVYLYSLTSGGKTQTKKMLLLK